VPRTIAGRESDWGVDGVASKANAVARVSRSSSRANRVIVDRLTPARCAICRRDIPRQLQHEIRRAWRA
jgi:hypothetical protein